MKKSIILLLSLVTLTLASCDADYAEQKSDSGVKKAHVEVQTDTDGHTAEQKNIMLRLERDNEIGSVKHLYVISSYSGDVLQYSTVKGKVTSGGKRLSPKTLNNSAAGNATSATYQYVTMNGETKITDEVLDDGGAYGESGNYLFWFDAQGNYHQYYPSGGTYLHIADKPMRVKRSNISIELIE